jgi:23S rRNA (cytosine1962-C5)-methyltransferase
VLKPGREAAPRRRRHPWIYRQAVAGIRGTPEPGDLLPVETSAGEAIGWGFSSPTSLIAVRMVSFEAERPSEDWLEQRIARAIAVRRSLSLDADAVRLVNAEGDFLPGLVVDRYAGAVVVSAHVRGAERLAGRAAASIVTEFPGVRVYFRRDEHYGRVEGLVEPSGWLAGAGATTEVVTEGSTRMLVDFERGQKTGYYLDQRANRSLCASLAAGRRVLNLFAYTGAFALRAARAGAATVVSVESSARALEVAAGSVGLNPEIDPSRLTWIKADVMEFLPGAGGFDLVVCDPPPFARRRREVEGAIRGYLALNQGALARLAPGGFLLTFSCSGAVDRSTFRQILEEAVLRCGRRARFVRELHADADHPVACGHPEGEYLKGWILHAD